MRGKSTCTNLIEYTTYIAEALDSGSEVHAIYTDFSKAFDSVDHLILINKLSKCGIQGTLLKWFISYLSRRKLIVNFGGSKSEPFYPSTGVPQGSVLGPILFAILINDLCDDLKCNILLFADDAKLFRIINSPKDSEDLQHDLNNIAKWCDKNKLKLNIAKCNFIVFSNRHEKTTVNYFINNTELTEVDTIGDLGVTFDNRLRFDMHIENIIKKANKMIGFVLRISSDFTNLECINLLYNTLVRSKLEYCTAVWTPFQQIHIINIEKI